MAVITGRAVEDDLIRYIKGLEARIARIEQEQPRGVTFRDNTRIRVQVGLMGDGKYGIRIWNAAGTLQIDNTY